MMRGLVSLPSIIGNRRSRLIGDGLTFIVLAPLAILFVLPFFWMVMTALKGPEELYVYPPRLLPAVWHWDNFVQAWTAVPFGRFFVNSAIIAGAATAGQILTCSMAAYSFARLHFPGRDRIFLAYIGTMMIPFPVLIIPLFAVMMNLHLVNTLAGVFLPAMFGAWGTFLMRQYLLTLPREIEDAARIDGCSYFGIYWRIVLPLVSPAIATLAIFTFVTTWNEFLWPLIIINSVDNKPVSLGLTMFQSHLMGQTPWNLVMAGTTLSMLPVVLVFLIGQRYYVRGIALSGLHGQ
jgi:multiple sugar transport system permease protein